MANEVNIEAPVITFFNDDYDYEIELNAIPLTQEEIENLLNQGNKPSPRIENEVSASVYKVSDISVGVSFTNKGFLLDFVDYVETNLIVRHSESNATVGWKISYYKLPHGTWKVTTKTVAGWTKAKLIGGYYIDVFGTELGISTASAVIYN